MSGQYTACTTFIYQINFTKLQQLPVVTVINKSTLPLHGATVRDINPRYLCIVRRDVISKSVKLNVSSGDVEA